MGESEIDRMRAVRRLGILNSGPEERFDRLARLAREFLDAPIAVVSLIGEEQAWIKACAGLSAQAAAPRSTFWNHAIDLPPRSALVIPDATRDDRFARDPWVIAPPHVRFCAGVPLAGPDGVTVGALCVLDTRPRLPPSDRELARLRNLAELVEHELQATHIRSAVVEQARLLDLSEEVSGIGHWRFDFDERRYTGSSLIYRIHGHDPDPLDAGAERLLTCYTPEQRQEIERLVAHARTTGEGCQFAGEIVRPDGGRRHVLVRASCQLDGRGRPVSLVGIFQDVTGAVEAQRRMEQTEARFQLISENTSDVVTAVTRTGRLTYISPRCEQVTGYTQEELLSQSPMTFMHPDDRPAVIDAFQRTLAGEVGCQVEYRFVGKAGQITWVEARPSALRDPITGEVVGVTDSMRDITSRKAAEAALAVSEVRFRTLANAASDAVIETSIDGELVYASNAIQDLTGYAPSELAGVRTIDLIHPDDRDRVREAAAAWRADPVGSVPGDGRFRLLHKDGGVRWSESRPTLITDPMTGELTGIADILRDITARKAIEDALAASEARYRGLAEAAPDMITETDRNGVIQYISPACERVIGVPGDLLIGANVFSLMHPEDAEKARAACDRQLETRGRAEPVELEYRGVLPSGELIWLGSRPTAILDPTTGDVTGFIDVVRNITQAKALMAELRRTSQEAEAAAVAKSNFLANMSHEIRTPLTSVIGFAGLLEQIPALPPLAADYSKLIVSSGQALMSIVNDVLDVAKFEAGQVELHPAPFAVHAFFRSVVSSVEFQAQKKGLTLSILFADALPDTVVADAVRVRQVFLNLLVNAIKFTDRGWVQVRVEAESGEDGRDRLRVAVRDSGPGIAPEHQPRLFQRFSQADTTSSRPFSGAGLGLAISKTLTETMGGRIGVETAVGEGATFWFTFEAPQGAMAHAAAEGDTPPASLDPIRILIVDDVDANRQLATALLAPFDVSLTSAQNGADAIEAALQQPFDVILMDLQMPGMDGMATCRAIRATSGYNSATPILAWSANVLPEQVAACAAAGMNDHISKPIDPVEFLNKISRWVAPSTAA